MGIRQDLENQGYKVDWNPSGVIHVTDPKTGKSTDLLPGSYYVDRSGTAQWYGNTKQQVQNAFLGNSDAIQSANTSGASSVVSVPASTSNSNSMTSNQYLQSNGLLTANNGLNNNNFSTQNLVSAFTTPATPTIDNNVFASYNSVIQSQQDQLNQLQQTVTQLVQALQNNYGYPSQSAYLSALASYGNGAQSVGNTNVTVPAGTPVASTTTDTSTTTPQAPSQLSTLGATMSLGVPLVSVVPSADDVYNLYKQYNNGQDNAQAQAFFASPDFQQVLQGNIPTWMLTNPGWSAFLQKLFQLYNPQADANTLALFNKLLTSVQ
jgi:hypothetical protein